MKIKKTTCRSDSGSFLGLSESQLNDSDLET